MSGALPTRRFVIEPGVSAPSVVDRNRALLAHGTREVYKQIGDQALEVYIYSPSEPSTGPVPAILFFCSSSWDAGLISQFAPHALHFAQRGILAMLVDYRVSSRHNTRPEDAMADARSALRWVRKNAERLGIDPGKIIASGGSAGGHIACSAAMLEGFDDPSDDASIPCAPDALVLFSPFLDCTLASFGLEKFPDKHSAKVASPFFKVRKKLPPMLIFHGTSDRVIPASVSRKFAAKLRWKGNKKSRFSPYNGQGHGFFNFNVDVTQFERTLGEMDAFLVELGYLQADPEMSEARMS